MQTTIILEDKQAKMFAMMQVLDKLGVFDVIYGSVTINFDGQGKISNVEIKRNFRTIEFGA